jgi:hypothetical protein
VYVQTLALADKRSTIGCEIYNLLLTDLPDSLVDGLDLIGDPGNLLDRATVGDDHVLHLVVPKLEIHKLPKKPGTDNLELASKYTARINIAIKQSATD